MEEEEKVNIWKNLNPPTIEKSAYDLLKEQSENLRESTNEHLVMDLMINDAILDTGEVVTLYPMYIRLPKVGNFRQKILTVQEDRTKKEHFPVDIVIHVDEHKRKKNIDEKDFLKTISDILKESSVEKVVQNLYRASLEHVKSSTDV